MSNMSYCRFNNTLGDLQDCIEALRNREISSSEEKIKAKFLLKEVLDFCHDEGIIEKYDQDQIEDIVGECK